MKFIQGYNRDQTHLFPVSLDQSIAPDNQVRFIDLFVDSLPLIEFGFRTDFMDNGRPAYHPSVLLKLYIYGYLNKIRSSRDLEKECSRNIEMMWLIKCLKPDHNTISNFRRDNPKAIKKVFRATVQIAKHFELIGGDLIAGDSTKFRAQNSKKNNFNQKKIDRHIAYIDNKLEQYNQQLAEHPGIDVLVAVPGIPRSSQAPNPMYNVEHFIYCHKTNTYTCPQKNILSTNGTWHQGRNYKFRQYKTPTCKNCPVRPECTKSAQNGKIIQRGEFLPAIERNREGSHKKWISTEKGKLLLNIHMVQLSDNGGLVIF